MERLDPKIEARVREAFALQGFMRQLGARLTSLGPGRAEVRVSFDPALTQHHGSFHAGVSAAIADTACGFAAHTLMAATSSVVSVEYKINLLAPARGKELIARARVVRAGKTLKVCAADVYVVDEAETLCATMLGTMIELTETSGAGRRASSPRRSRGRRGSRRSGSG
jgi:uncharacterized protein (TIGR00369 family)